MTVFAAVLADVTADVSATQSEKRLGALCALVATQLAPGAWVAPGVLSDFQVSRPSP